MRLAWPVLGLSLLACGAPRAVESPRRGGAGPAPAETVAPSDDERADDSLVDALFVGPRDVCARLRDRGRLACAHLSTGGVDYAGELSGDVVGLGRLACVAEAAHVRCGHLPELVEVDAGFASVAHRLVELDLPFAPRALFFLTGRAGADHRRAPDELCARGESGEVRCVTLDEARRERVLFERSRRVRADAEVAYSLRDDGVLECVGGGSCVAIVTALGRMTGPGGGGHGGSRPVWGRRERDVLADVATGWPIATESLGRIQRAATLPIGRVDALHDAKPCVGVHERGLVCWEMWESPRTMTDVPAGHEPFPWGSRLCARQADRVACTAANGEDATPVELPVPALQYAARVGPALCAIDRRARLACLLSPQSALWEVVRLDLAAGEE